MSSPTGIVSFDVLLIILGLVFGSNLVVEVFKAIYGTWTGKAKERAIEKKNKLVEQNFAQEDAYYWRAMTHELKILLIEQGVHRDDLPQFEPPSDKFKRSQE